MRKHDRTFRPTDPRVPAPIWAWAVMLGLIGLLGLVAGIAIIVS